MRITEGDADAAGCSPTSARAPAASPPRQRDRLRQAHAAPVRRPARRRSARCACAPSSRARRQYRATSSTRRAGSRRPTTRSAASTTSSSASASSWSRAANGTMSPADRKAIAAEIDQLIAQAKSAANATLRRPLHLRRQRHRRAPVRRRAPPTPTRGNTGADRPHDRPGRLRAGQRHRPTPCSATATTRPADDGPARLAAQLAATSAPGGATPTRCAPTDLQALDETTTSITSMRARRRRARRTASTPPQPAQAESRRRRPGCARRPRTPTSRRRSRAVHPAVRLPGRAAGRAQHHPAVAPRLPAVTRTRPRRSHVMTIEHALRDARDPRRGASRVPERPDRPRRPRYALLARAEDAAFVWLHSVDDPRTRAPGHEPVAVLRRLRRRAVRRRGRAHRRRRPRRDRPST